MLQNYDCGSLLSYNASLTSSLSLCLMLSLSFNWVCMDNLEDSKGLFVRWGFFKEKIALGETLLAGRSVMEALVLGSYQPSLRHC